MILGTLTLPQRFSSRDGASGAAIPSFLDCFGGLHPTRHDGARAGRSLVGLAASRALKTGAGRHASDRWTDGNCPFSTRHVSAARFPAEALSPGVHGDL